jgi:hypothetical protein
VFTGDDAAMMKTLLVRADSVVRGQTRSAEMTSMRRSYGDLLAIVILFGGLYGAAMGTFGGMGGERALQMLYSALKVPFLLLMTFGLSLPGFFIFNTLQGLRTDYPHALRALLAGQAGLTVILTSLAPLTLLWNVSTTGHQAAVLFNAVMFGVATAGGQVLLRRAYAELLIHDARHGLMLRLWGIVYTFVGIQMGWILRPFVGEPNKPTAFFRTDAWSNAYVALFQLLHHVLTGQLR